MSTSDTALIHNGPTMEGVHDDSIDDVGVIALAHERLLHLGCPLLLTGHLALIQSLVPLTVLCCIIYYTAIVQLAPACRNPYTR